MIKTYDVHMDPLERTSQIITLTEVINDILVSNSPSRDEKLKALLAILISPFVTFISCWKVAKCREKRGQPMNNSINAPRLTSALQLIEQAAAVWLLSVFRLKKWTLLMSWMRLKRAHLWLTMLVQSW